MSDPLHRLLIGRSLVGRYRPLEVVGRGGMGVVFRARDERLGRDVALKIISVPEGPEVPHRDELRERLRREASAAARIPTHPNVVQIYDHGTDPELELDFIAMELLQGIDLRCAMREERLDFRRALRILQEAARGLAAGHRAGIIHRDVKPANIFLIGSEHGDSDHLEGVKLLDFGIAKALVVGEDDELTRHERIPHSPAYSSPEQTQAGAPVTPASDVYQLGLVAYELLAGARPFTDEERERIRGGEEIGVPARGNWNSVDRSVRGVVEQALRVDPTRRFSDAGEFASALARTELEDRTEYLGGPATPLAGPDATDYLGAPAVVPEGRHATTVQSDGWKAPPTATPHETAPVRRRMVLGLPHAAALGAVLLGAAIVLLTRGGDDSQPGTLTGAEVTASIEELHAEFRPLLMEAFRNVSEAASPFEGEEAAAAVQWVIYRLHESMVDGDVEAHLAAYAERPEIEGRRVTRDRLEADRRDLFDRYPEREVTLSQMAIHFFAPGNARALIDRRWRFEGDETWEGSARDELILERQGDAWKIVGERELERFEEQRS
jgi:serine/threonine protein kinase